MDACYQYGNESLGMHPTAEQRGISQQTIQFPVAQTAQPDTVFRVLIR
jgi:hypothetical protein